MLRDMHLDSSHNDRILGGGQHYKCWNLYMAELRRQIWI
jgi:hypothetical protein